MYKRIVSAFLWLIFFAACKSNKQTNLKKYDTITQENNTSQASPALQYKLDTSKYVTNALLPKRDTLLTVDLKNNKGSVQGYLSGAGKHVIVMVPVTSGDSIYADIVPDNDSTNIRFNQIYVPLGKEGKYDGPFSRTISYPITVKGNYKLIIGTNLMAEGKPEGSFTCNVWIK